MSKYIERKAVMDALMDDQYGYLCEDAIKAIPNADGAPVKHGRWIHKKDKCWMGGGKTVCSVCESGLSDGGYIAVRTFSYCPECGAKMDGGKNV